MPRTHHKDGRKDMEEGGTRHDKRGCGHADGPVMDHNKTRKKHRSTSPSMGNAWHVLMISGFHGAT